MSCSQCQELGQRANLSPDWLPKNKGPIRSQVSSLTQLLTLTTTQKFPPLSKGPVVTDGETVEAVVVRLSRLVDKVEDGLPKMKK